MNKTLIMNTIKRNWKLLLIFFAVLSVYLAIIILLIDPQDMEKVRELYGAMGGMLGAFGISIEAMTSPLSYTASSFFGILVMAFTMVFYIIQSSRLIAKPVDDNSIVYTLTMPISRTKLIVTQAVYLIASIFVIFAGILVVGTICLANLGDFNFGIYLNLVILFFLLCTVMAMLSFFFSVAFCDSKKGTALASGLPIGLLILSMLGGAGGDKTQWLMRISPFGWIDAVAVVNGSVSTWWMYPVFISLIAVLFAASMIVFNKKRLPV